MVNFRAQVARYNQGTLPFSLSWFMTSNIKTIQTLPMILVNWKNIVPGGMEKERERTSHITHVPYIYICVCVCFQIYIYIVFYSLFEKLFIYLFIYSIYSIFIYIPMLIFRTLSLRLASANLWHRRASACAARPLLLSLFPVCIDLVRPSPENGKLLVGPQHLAFGGTLW